MLTQDKNNQIIIYNRVTEVKHPVALRRHPSKRGELKTIKYYLVVQN